MNRRLLAVILTAGALTGSALIFTGTAQASAPSIYDQPASFAGTHDGQILQSQPVTIQAAGFKTPYRAWQLSYVTEDTNGNPQADVATVVVPLGKNTHQLLSYQPAIDSLSASCQPSYILANSPAVTGFNSIGGLESFAAVATGTSLGYTVVIPDFEGPNHEWTAGIESGRGTLDAIRAAESFTPDGLAGPSTQVAMMGYSGGSQASEFAAELAPTYAPELDIVGAAIGGLPVNIAHIAAHVDGTAFSGVYFAAAIGIARAYPQINIDSLLNSAGEKLKQNISGMCITQFVPTYAFQHLTRYTVNGVNPLSLPVIQQVATADQMGVIGTPKIPMQVYMATYDELVVTPDVATLVKKYCAAGERIQYLNYLLADHISAAGEGLPAAISYIQARFAGKPAPSTC